MMKLCIIEDNPIHQEQLKAALAEAGHESYCVGYKEVAQRRNYTVEGCDAAIVDLQLDPNSSFHEGDGFKLVNEELWPVDRDMWFIVFSSHIKGTSADEIIWHRSRLQPKVVFVPKILDEENERIAQSALAQLINVVLTPLSIILPRCYKPIETKSSEHILEIATIKDKMLEEFRDEVGGSFNKNITQYLERYTQSNDVLKALSERLLSLLRMGILCEEISVVVYGSFGRREAHLNSDVEFVILRLMEIEGNHPRVLQSRDIAAIAWNKCVIVCEELNREAEGKEMFPLDPREAFSRDSQGENKYAPAISMKDIIEKRSLATDPQARNRLVQLLTEVFPIFNEAGFRLNLSHMIYNAVDKENGSGLQKALRNKVIGECFENFELDIRVSSDKARNEKLALGRYFSGWSFRLTLIMLVIDAKDLKDDQVLNMIVSPPLIRVTSFYKLCLNSGIECTEENGAALRKAISTSLANAMILWNFLIEMDEYSESQKTITASLRKSTDETIDILQKIYPELIAEWYMKPMGNFGVTELSVV